MYIFQSKSRVLIYFLIIFLIFFSNFCNIYSQTTNVTNNETNTNVIISKPKDIIDNNLTQNTTSYFVPDYIRVLVASFPLYFVSIVATVMVVPMLVYMIMAYRRFPNESIGMIILPNPRNEGFYRTLMTFGVVLLSGITLVYLLALMAIYKDKDIIEIFKNFSTIIGTGFTTIIAFYFGSKGFQNSDEKSAKRFDSSRTNNLTNPSVLKIKPGDGEDNVPINTYIYAKFNKPIEPSSINKTTFTITNSLNEPIDGEISLIEKNAKAIFKANLAYATKYIATIDSFVTDLDDNPMAQDKIWSFTTKNKESALQAKSSNHSEDKQDMDSTITK
jgi:hypothetical protein